MSCDSDGELASFLRFLGEKLAQKVDMSPEEALDIWRTNHPLAEDDDVAAVNEALAEMEAGDTGVPFAEFDRQSRARHQLPP
jgi:hypothetical protein